MRPLKMKLVSRPTLCKRSRVKIFKPVGVVNILSKYLKFAYTRTPNTLISNPKGYGAQGASQSCSADLVLSEFRVGLDPAAKKIPVPAEAPTIKNACFKQN